MCPGVLETLNPGDLFSKLQREIRNETTEAWHNLRVSQGFVYTEVIPAHVLGVTGSLIM